MEDVGHPILGKGRYRLLALTPGREYTRHAVTGYAVATLAGDTVHVAATLAQARAWLEQQLRHDARPPPLRMRMRHR